MFDEHIIFDILSGLDANKASGPDGVSSKVLIETASIISKPLGNIFSASFSSGNVTSDWRIANVAPIFKIGSKSDPGNYS